MSGMKAVGLPGKIICSRFIPTWTIWTVHPMTCYTDPNFKPKRHGEAKEGYT